MKNLLGAIVALSTFVALTAPAEANPWHRWGVRSFAEGR